MDVFTQNESIFSGTGKITYGLIEAEVAFQIEYSPFNLILKTTKIVGGQMMGINYGKFEGIITGSNIPITCTKIGLSNYSKYKMTFVMLEDLIIGAYQEAKMFSANLFDLDSNINEFEIDNYLIKYTLFDNFMTLDKYNKKFGSTLETGVLDIKKKNLEIINVVDVIQLSEDLNLLLSLMLAKNILYNRYNITNCEDSKSVIRIKTVLNSSGTKFIFREDFDAIIPVMYNAFSKLSDAEKKCIHTVVLYLNSTSNKYLEDSILSIAQIWEILSDTFLKEKIENSENIKLLKTSLKTTIKEWHKNNFVVDYDLDFISNRVLGSMDWEKVILKLETLVENSGLSGEKIDLNFKELISIRNQIAHSGRFKVVGKEDFYNEVYNKSLLGIKIFILNKLAYEGIIVEKKGGVYISKNINEYLK